MGPASGTFAGSPIDQADGFIHLSTAAQLADTLDRHFTGQAGLVISAIDLSVLGDAVRWEPSRERQMFPHCYAPLTRDAVIVCIPVEGDEEGVVLALR